MRVSVSQSVSSTVRSLSHPVQSMSHACIVQESWDHMIPASLSVRKTPHLSPYQRRSLSQHPQKLNRRVARYIAFLADFDFELVHLPGKRNQADPLSRRPDHDDGSTDNEETTALPNELFARAIEITILERQVHQLQKENNELCLAWKKKYGIYQDKWKVWWKAGSLVVLDDRQL
jgi:hypothetical protein